MDLGTLTIIMICTCGALICGMAALIQKMVVGKLDGLQETINGLSSDLHHIDIRLTKLEAEHAICHYRGDE